VPSEAAAAEQEAAAAEQEAAAVKQKKTPERRQPCTADSKDCDYWAELGECEKNPNYMLTTCSEACTGCKPTRAELKDRKRGKKKKGKNRCKRDKGDKPLIKKGELNKIFERIVSDPEINEMYNVTTLSTDPFIITIDGVVIPEESAGIIESVSGKFEGSSGTGAIMEDGTFAKEVTSYRTSRNAWCHEEPCRSLAVSMNVEDKIAALTGVPRENQEYLQILDYGPDQYYKQHHDFIPGHMDMPCGPRILTAFIYFNEVEEGGGTRFNKLNITVQPKPGRMLLWPSVKNSNPKKIDTRTDHEAMPVIAGVKQAANAWLHLYAFRKYNLLGCTG